MLVLVVLIVLVMHLIVFVVLIISHCFAHLFNYSLLFETKVVCVGRCATSE